MNCPRCRTELLEEKVTERMETSGLPSYVKNTLPTNRFRKRKQILYFCNNCQQARKVFYFLFARNEWFGWQYIPAANDGGKWQRLPAANYDVMY